MRLSFTLLLLSLAILMAAQSVQGDWKKYWAPKRPSRAAAPAVEAPAPEPAHHSSSDAEPNSPARSSEPDPDADYNSDSPDPDADHTDEGSVDWQAEYGQGSSSRHHDGEASGSLSNRDQEEDEEEEEADEDEDNDGDDESEEMEEARGDYVLDQYGNWVWVPAPDADDD